MTQGFAFWCRASPFIMRRIGPFSPPMLQDRHKLGGSGLMCT